MASLLEDSSLGVSRWAWRPGGSAATLDLTIHAHCGRGPKRSLKTVPILTSTTTKTRHDEKQEPRCSM